MTGEYERVFTLFAPAKPTLRKDDFGIVHYLASHDDRSGVWLTRCYVREESPGCYEYRAYANPDWQVPPDAFPTCIGCIAMAGP